jgi:carbon-monoxide dehydrogenase medium subunit
VAPTPLFVSEAGRVLKDQPVSPESIRQAADVARAAARPITDMRGTADYRRHLCAVLTRRVIESAVEHALGAN